MKSLLKAWLPAGVVRWSRRVRGRAIRLTGDYTSWEAARRASTGYDAADILQRVLAATRAVRAGQAAFERDAVLFAQPEANHPLLAGLLGAAARSDGRLVVADFGGSLGSVYWQHRRWLEGLAALRWCVVEQPHFVAAGRRELADEQLGFYDSLAECVVRERPTVLLLSSVLPYLERPHALVAETIATGFRWVLIDRTPVGERDRDRLAVQRVPASIYPASYPCWIFARSGLLRPFERDYRLLDEWLCPDEAGGVEFRGFLFARSAP